jgi:hypothetical protein
MTKLINGMPVVARCSKCKRDFLSIPLALREGKTAYDVYGRADERPSRAAVCHGVIQLTDAGREALQQTPGA